MDNFLQILFFLFIIFSFIAPLFKKKKEQGQKQQTKAQNQNNPERQRAKAELKKEMEEYDILNEIQGLFKPPEEIKKPAETQTYEQSYKESPYETPEWEKALKTEHTINDEWHRATTEADFNKESAVIDIEAKRIQKLIDDKNKPVNVRLGELRKSIRNPETLKQYFLISEIIGKPRAVKRQVR
ncbi:MAG TPA: hypothetical protein VJ954_03985 [Ignavibacteriaceae bacterium]|nr:hypothetical protein [Ignavibacteriaceae bacterium]